MRRLVRTPSFAAGTSEEGTAVVLALLAMVLLLALGIGLLTVGDTERAIAANRRAAAQTFYAADAALDRALADLLLTPRWSIVVRGDVRAGFVDASLTPVAPWGQRLDLVQKTAARQRQSDALLPAGANNPQWHLYAYGPLDALASTTGQPNYLVVWAADDPSETDDDPAADSNGVLTLWAEALGPNGADRAVEVTVARANLRSPDQDDGAERGGDGANRRSAAAPVQVPGKAVTIMSLTLGTDGMAVQ